MLKSDQGHTAYGQFRLAWGAACVTIHALDQHRRANYEQEYLDKLEKVIEALKGFAPVLGTQHSASYREWLNPQETGATGSIAYHYDVSDANSTVFFEFASCDDKIRIYPHHFPRPQLKNMQRCLDNIRVELVNHRATFIRQQRLILESVNKE